MNYLKLILTISVFCLSAYSFGQTYSNTDTVPGRGRGNTGIPLKFNEFFDQSKIPGIIGTPSEPVELTLLSGHDERVKLQNKIDEISNAGGGYLLVGASGDGPVFLNQIKMKSNVHLMFKANVTLEFPGIEGSNMFEFGGGQGAEQKIYNAALTCETALGNTTNKDDWFTVNLGSNLKVAGYTEDGKRVNRNFCSLKHAENFLVSGIKFQDNLTKIAAVNFSTEAQLINPDGTMPDGSSDKRTMDSRGYGPRKGIFSNVELTKGAGGYGLTQIQVAKDVLFYNLKTVDGGVVFRLESGTPAACNTGFVWKDGEIIPNPNPTNIRTIDSVFGRKIRCINGSHAVLMNPHRVHQGVVDIDDVYTKGCAVAVHISSGFLDANGKEEAEAIKGPALDHAGTFDSACILTNITAESGGDHDAKLTRRGARVYSCEFFNSMIKPFATEGENSWGGPSVGGVDDTARPKGDAYGNCESPKGCYTIDIDPDEIHLIGDNFGMGKENYKIFSDKIHLSTISKSGDCKVVNTPVSSAIKFKPIKTFYPNPTKSKVFLNEYADYQVYSGSGQLLEKGKSDTVDFSNQASGIYFLKVGKKSYKVVKK